MNYSSQAVLPLKGTNQGSKSPPYLLSNTGIDWPDAKPYPWPGQCSSEQGLLVLLASRVLPCHSPPAWRTWTKATPPVGMLTAH